MIPFMTIATTLNIFMHNFLKNIRLTAIMIEKSINGSKSISKTVVFIEQITRETKHPKGIVNIPHKNPKKCYRDALEILR